MSTQQSSLEVLVCDSLLAEHRTMERLLTALERVAARPDVFSVAGREALLELLCQIDADLNTHFACEEQALFPAVSPYHPMVLMEVEHEQVMTLWSALKTQAYQPDTTLLSADELPTLAGAFIQVLRAHIDREDKGIFPACERALSTDEKRVVVEKMEHIRVQSLTAPTPPIQRAERTFKASTVSMSQPLTRPLFAESLAELPGMVVKHLAVQAGQALKEHWTPKEAVLICIQGTGVFHSGIHQVPLQPGTVIYMDPQLRHGVKAYEDCHLLLLLR